MVWPRWKGPAVVSVFTIDTSTAVPVTPLLPELSVLFAVFGSNSAAVAVAVLPSARGAVSVAVTWIVVFARAAGEAIVHGSAEQPLPLTFVIVRFVGVSVTWIDVAVDGAALDMTSVQLIDGSG